MYYLIDNILRSCTAEECHSGKYQYVAVLSLEEWNAECDSYEMGIDLEPNIREIYTTNAEVNYDSITGSFAIPDRSNISGDYNKFAFALDEKGIVFIDSGDTVLGIINRIIKTKKWRMPSLERFIYDFLAMSFSNNLSVFSMTQSMSLLRENSRLILTFFFI